MRIIEDGRAGFTLMAAKPPAKKKGRRRRKMRLTLKQKKMDTAADSYTDSLGWSTAWAEPSTTHQGCGTRVHQRPVRNVRHHDEGASHARPATPSRATTNRAAHDGFQLRAKHAGLARGAARCVDALTGCVTPDEDRMILATTTSCAIRGSSTCCFRLHQRHRARRRRGRGWNRGGAEP